MKKITLLIMAVIIHITLVKGQDCIVCSQNPTGFGANIIGFNSTADGAGSVAIGTNSHTTSFAGNSIAIGTQVKSVNYLSMVIGSGKDSQNMLVNHLQQTLMVGFGSSKPTFFVSRSLSATRTGRIGIGNVTEPQAKLHLRADDGEEAAVFIEPNNWGAVEEAGLAIGNLYHGITAKKNVGLQFHTQLYYTFNEGNVGIGTPSPSANLHIKGSDRDGVATVFIDPFTWSGGAQAHLFIGNKAHGVSVDYRAGLIFRTQSAYLFNDGNIGIGTGEEYLPEEKLEVVGTIKTTGLRLQNESAQTGFVLTCGGINGQAAWQNPAEFAYWTENKDGNIYRMGRIGINTQYPQTELDINGNIRIGDALYGKITDSKWINAYLTIQGSLSGNASKIMISKGNDNAEQSIKIINPTIGGDIQFHAGGSFNAVLRNTEFIIGFPNHFVDLKVNGKIWTREVEVQLTGWSDYVFEDGYKLMPLHQLENYIETNNHLPDIPTVEDVLENGIKLGEMNALLLKKVEELTLYIIELKKEMETIKQKQVSN